MFKFLFKKRIEKDLTRSNIRQDINSTSNITNYTSNIEQNSIVHAVLEIRTNQVALDACNVNIINEAEAKYSIDLLNNPNIYFSKFDLFKNLAKEIILKGSVYLEFINNILVVRSKNEISFDKDNQYFINQIKGEGYICNIGNGTGIMESLKSLVHLHIKILEQLSYYGSDPYNIYCIDSNYPLSTDSDQSELHKLINNMTYSKSGASISSFQFSKVYNAILDGRASVSDLLEIKHSIENQISTYASLNSTILSTSSRRFVSDHNEYNKYIVKPLVMNIYMGINRLFRKMKMTELSIRY